MREVHRLWEFDAIRVVAIALVVGVLHADAFVNATAPGFFVVPLGVYNVLVATLLGSVTSVSGFLNGRAAESLGFREGAGFLGRRLLRLYPIYALAFTLFWLLYYREASIPWVLAQYSCAGVLLAGLLGPVTLTLWYVQMLMLLLVSLAVLRSLRSTACGVA